MDQDNWWDPRSKVWRFAKIWVSVWGLMILSRTQGRNECWVGLSGHAMQCNDLHSLVMLVASLESVGLKPWSSRCIWNAWLSVAFGRTHRKTDPFYTSYPLMLHQAGLTFPWLISTLNSSWMLFRRAQSIWGISTLFKPWMCIQTLCHIFDCYNNLEL